MHIHALRTYDHSRAVMSYQCLLYLFALSFHLSFVLTDQDTPEKFTINLHHCCTVSVSLGFKTGLHFGSMKNVKRNRGEC